MVLKLYGLAPSTCTKRVALVLHEKRVPFEFHNVDLQKGEHKTREFTSKQPFGQVPYIDDDGFIVYESRAIARYIVETYPEHGPELIPKDPKKKALFEQAACIETSNFATFAEPAVAEMVFKPMRKVASDIPKFEGLITSLSAKLDVYNEILDKQEYLGGEEVTLADLFHLPYATMLEIAEKKYNPGKPESNIMTERPNVKRWFESLESRPSWQAVKGGVESVKSYNT